MFDPIEFQNSSNEATLDEKFNQLEAGEYRAQIGIDEKAIEVNTGEKEGKPWAQMTVKLEVLDPSGEIETKLGRKPVISYRFFLDLVQEQGSANFGKPDWSKQKNVRMGALLGATGLNKPGWSVPQLKGKSLKIKVAKVKDQNGEPRSEVVMVGVDTGS